MYNGTMTTFELAQKQDSVLILAVQDNKIIVTQEENPSSVSTNRRLPGGRMDPGETDPLLSAKRELLEETWLVSDQRELFATYNTDQKLLYTKHVFIAKDCRKVAQQSLDGGEKIILHAYTFDAFIDFICDWHIHLPQLENTILRHRLDNTISSFQDRLWLT